MTASRQEAAGPGAGPAPAPRCSDAARERGDPMVGTAPRPHRWLLLEHPGPWPVDAVAGSGIAPEVLARLQAAADRATARILLVRRPAARGAASRDAGGPGEDPPRRWFVLGSHPGAAASAGHWQRDEDLLAAAAALSSPRLDGQLDPLLLVCAHGRHDTCCAVRGRPVAAALARHWPERVWECSHVGGDRFAANLVVLPDGWYYGGLGPEQAVEAARAHLSGAVDPRWVRGMTSEPPVAQAAVVAAMHECGRCPAGTVHSTGVRRRPDGRWQVDLSGGLTATVAVSTAPPEVLTCRAPRASAATRYDVVDLRPVVPRPPA